MNENVSTFTDVEQDEAVVVADKGTKAVTSNPITNTKQIVSTQTPEHNSLEMNSAPIPSETDRQFHSECDPNH